MPSPQSPNAALEAQSGAEIPSPDNVIGTVPRIGRLDTAAGVRRELGRLYRAARRTAGANPLPGQAGKLAYILGAISRSLEVEDLAERVRAIEGRLAE